MSKLTSPKPTNPFQMISVALIEGALVAGIYAIEQTYLQILIVVVVIIIALGFAGTLVYMNLYLLHKYPHLLYNPSDYDPSVQKLLFSLSDELTLEIKPSESVDKVTVEDSFTKST